MAKKKPPKVKDLDAEDYSAVAQDHTHALAATYDNRDYTLTIYSAGVAVECLFRALREKKGLPFTSDHYLEGLADEAGFPDVIPERHRERFDAALNKFFAGWQNKHRFRSNDAMRRFLKGLKLDRGIKGGFLKENARRISSSAFDLVASGITKWQA